jgi:5'(3')-deoxyribonucleotidase
MNHKCNCLEPVVALDVESVIADIHSAWINRFDKSFTIDDITDWEFKSLKAWNENLESFLAETDSLWNNSPEIHIPPMISNLKEITDKLKPFDIVTSRRTLSGIKQWVDFHQLEYRAIVYISEKQTKTDLNYEVFIDDNPELAPKLKKNQFLWLISQPYNKNVEETEQVCRVDTIVEINPRKST